MRITNSMLVRNMMTNLNKNMKRMSKLQEQYQSGKLFQLPSDNPIGVSKSLKLYTDKSKIEQYKTNLRDAIAWMYTTEDALDQMGEVLKRASDLTIRASNDTFKEDDLQAIRAEIRELREQVIQAANTTHAGRHVFSGYKTDKPLLVTGEDGVTRYNIDLESTEVSTYNVGVSENIEVNTVGIKVFGVGDANYQAASVTNTDEPYVIKVFDNIIKALGSGTEEPDKEELRKNIDVIKEVFRNTVQVRAEIGAKTNRLEMTEKRLDSDAVNFTRLLSENEDADLAEVIMNFKMAESVYLASMSSGARIIQPSLIDFLR
ncbi:Flagellar hook-associated protein 3 HAP3 [Proteiniborus sp. DW1]|uniref:flagellar hook-associated protein FlgL n=1 Tax=Proteiniborus sp. DW1 TaxID=1889883 RepID=UPI00092E0DE9|nr:flagellar hook-associated protein FlgL [Proteiniborus sp. DW1]SCG81905.1 Flagellar hook-associated protein 3 HAP3 [Proteiniborus sp. DW1]